VAKQIDNAVDKQADHCSGSNAFSRANEQIIPDNYDFSAGGAILEAPPMLLHWIETENNLLAQIRVEWDRSR